MKINFSSAIHLLIVSTLLCFAGCSQPPHPAADYPEPFHGQLLYGDSLIAPTPQTVAERIFQEKATERGLQFAVTREHATEDTPAYQIIDLPLSAVVDSRESVLYLMSLDSMYINKYDIRSGQLLQVITSPREKYVPSAYGAGLRIMPDDLIWVYGIEKRQIYEMDSEGKLGAPLEFMSGEGMAAGRAGNYVKITSANSDYLFHTFTRSGDEISSFGILSSERMKHNGKEYPGHGLGFAGQVISDGSDSFVYVANSAGKLLAHNMDGTFRYYRETIQTNPYPASVASESEYNVMRLDDEGVKGYHSIINIWQGVLYVKNFMTGEQQFVIDAYEYATGDYLYSFNLPDEAFPVFITADHLYVASTEGFFQMKRGAYRISNTES